MSVSEARRVLRRLELEAYACVVTALRAQGLLTLEKKSVLTQLSHQLSISIDRHHAEVRRAICDDDICYIADCVSGTDSKHSWLPEGRRLGRGNPKLVARHSLSSSTQAQALTALSLSGVRGGTNTKSDQAESGTEKKLPPQVQSALKIVLANHPSAGSSTVRSSKVPVSSSSPYPATPPVSGPAPTPSPVPTTTTVGCQTDTPPSPIRYTSCVGVQVDFIEEKVEEEKSFGDEEEEEDKVKEEEGELVVKAEPVTDSGGGKPMEEIFPEVTAIKEGGKGIEPQDTIKPSGPNTSSVSTCPDVPSGNTSSSVSMLATEGGTSLPVKRPLEEDEDESVPAAKIPHLEGEEQEVNGCQATNSTSDVDTGMNTLGHPSQDQSIDEVENSSEMSVTLVGSKDLSLENMAAVVRSTSPPPVSAISSSSSSRVPAVDMPILMSPQPVFSESETDANTSIPPITTPSTVPISSPCDGTQTVTPEGVYLNPDSGTSIHLPYSDSSVSKSEPVSTVQSHSDKSIPSSESSINSESVLHQLLTNQLEPVSSSRNPPSQTNIVPFFPSTPQTELLDAQQHQMNVLPHPLSLSHSQGDVTRLPISQTLFPSCEDVTVSQSFHTLPSTTFDSIKSLLGPDLPQQTTPFKEESVTQAYLPMTDDQALSSSLQEIEELLSPALPDLFQTSNVDKPDALIMSASFNSPLISTVPSVEDLSSTSSSSLNSLQSSSTSLSSNSSSSLIASAELNTFGLSTFSDLANIPSQMPPLVPSFPVLPITTLASSLTPPIAPPSLKNTNQVVNISIDSFSAMSPSIHVPPSTFNIPTSLHFQTQQAPPTVSLKLPIPPPSVQSIFSFPSPLVSNVTTPDSIPDASSLDGTPIDEGALLATVTSELGVESIDPSLLNMSDLLSFLPSSDMTLSDLAIMGGEMPSETIVLQEGVGGGALTPSEVEGAIGKYDDLSLTLKDIPPEIKDTVQAILKSQEDFDESDSSHTHFN